MSDGQCIYSVLTIYFILQYSLVKKKFTKKTQGGLSQGQCTKDPKGSILAYQKSQASRLGVPIPTSSVIRHLATLDPTGPPPEPSPVLSAQPPHVPLCLLHLSQRGIPLPLAGAPATDGKGMRSSGNWPNLSNCGITKYVLLSK